MPGTAGRRRLCDIATGGWIAAAPDCRSSAWRESAEHSSDDRFRATGGRVLPCGSVLDSTTLADTPLLREIIPIPPP
eukprot:9696833-Prorocentrum_lima.AAC.1